MAFDICKLLNITYPIIQGAMATISDAILASAVSNAGGLGVIAAGNRSVDWLKSEIKKAKELTDKPFAVNIMLLAENTHDIVWTIIDEDVKVVTTGAGSPAKYIDFFKESGIKIIPVIASVAQAKKMERSGVDAIIAEGMEAGGHIGKLTTMTLVPQVVDSVNIPVIAAGGIADGRGMAAAFMLGASGIQVGTRFLSAYECNVHKNYKNMIINAKDIDTTTTGLKSGHPVRVLKNKMTRLYEKLEQENAPIEEFENLTKGSLYKASMLGDTEFGSVMAGQIAGIIKREQSAAEIIEDIIKMHSDLIYEKGF